MQGRQPLTLHVHTKLGRFVHTGYRLSVVQLTTDHLVISEGPWYRRRVVGLYHWDNVIWVRDD